MPSSFRSRISRRLLTSALLLVLASACDERDAATDAAIDTGDTSTDAAVSCGELTSQLQTRLAAADRTCGSVNDCVVIGATVDVTGSNTCNCGVYFAPQCGGAVVARASWLDDTEVQALTSDWYQRCAPAGAGSGLPEICDCAPTHYDCVDNRCVATTPFDCFNRPDAGVGP